MSITMIWAMDSNHLIGKQNRLPWRIPHDMAFSEDRRSARQSYWGAKPGIHLTRKAFPSVEISL